MIVRTVLLVLAALIFLLIGPFEAITSNLYKWEMAAFAVAFVGLIPWRV